MKSINHNFSNLLVTYKLFLNLRDSGVSVEITVVAASGGVVAPGEVLECHREAGGQKRVIYKITFNKYSWTSVIRPPH